MSTMCFAIEPTRGRVEKRGRPRSIGMALAIIHTSSEDAELDEREQQDDEGEDERERGAKAELRLLERRLEDQQRHRPRGIERATEAASSKIPSGSSSHRCGPIPKMPMTSLTRPYCGWKTQKKTAAAATKDVT